MNCKHCGARLKKDRNFCPSCGQVVEPDRLKKIGIHPPTNSAKMDYFWETGDPSVFSGRNAPDHNPALADL
jgi:predicted amidophosphoribosyltransferase